MFTAISAIAILAGFFGVVLGYAAVRLRVEGDPVADQIEGLLPQMQCGQCGFAGCRQYAEAVATGNSDINKCAPGGDNTVAALADLLGRDARPIESDKANKGRQVAVVDEAWCVGCTLCIQACPVDAIIGAAKHMHTILQSECTGCELCVEPCPVACIHMVPVRDDLKSWKWPYPAPAREAA
jgi:Na+-translocating ferredoxin:NAD+ oxidoreductase subunit B